MAWFLAASPISLSSSVKETTEGVILLPSSLGMTSTCPFLKIPTQEYVVPKSIPMMGHSYFSSYARRVVVKRMRRVSLSGDMMDSHVEINYKMVISYVLKS